MRCRHSFMVSEKLAEKGGWSVSQPFYLLPWFLEGDVSHAGDSWLCGKGCSLLPCRDRSRRLHTGTPVGLLPLLALLPGGPRELPAGRAVPKHVSCPSPGRDAHLQDCTQQRCRAWCVLLTLPSGAQEPRNGDVCTEEQLLCGHLFCCSTLALPAKRTLKLFFFCRAAETQLAQLGPIRVHFC